MVKIAPVPKSEPESSAFVQCRSGPGDGILAFISLFSVTFDCNCSLNLEVHGQFLLVYLELVLRIHFKRCENELLIRNYKLLT